MKGIINISIVLVLLGYASTETVNKRSTVCHGELGCFSTDGEFQKGQRIISVPPLSPGSINTKFVLFTRDNPTKGTSIPATDMTKFETSWKTFRGDKSTKFIIHGYLDRTSLSTWMQQLTAEMLKHDDYNVILVDWSGGNVNLYSQATANTRVVGAQIALLTQKLMAKYNMSAGTFHAIGHSLGAHVGGYAGERVPGFGRISGLDPAGPFFENMAPVVRLDPTDAQFVDAIHTDGSPESFIGAGIRHAVGHVDFFPNDGNHQPGCSRSPVSKIFNLGIREGVSDVVACNHLRVTKLYVESVNSKCPFTAFPCKGASDFANGKCFSCGDGCSRMGFHADEYKPAQNTKYYLRTAADRPFCEYNLALTIFLGSMSGKERGHLKIQIHGQKGETKLLTLNELPKYFTPGEKLAFLASSQTDIGPVTYVDMSWKQRSTLLNPLSWNLLNLRRPQINVKQVNVKPDGADEIQLCATDETIQNEQFLKIIDKCKA